MRFTIPAWIGTGLLIVSQSIVSSLGAETGENRGNEPLAATTSTGQSMRAATVVAAPMPHFWEFGVSNGFFRCVLRGPVRNNYDVQVSSNLLDWVMFRSYTIPVTGSTPIADPVKGISKRFYRAVPQGVGPFVAQPAPSDSKDIWTTSVYSWAPGEKVPGGGLNDDRLRIGGWGDEYYILMQFDLTGLPAVAASAVLHLYCFNQMGGGTEMYLDQVTEFWDWRTQGKGRDRERLWWGDRPGTVQWSLGTIASPTPGEWYEVDITDL